MAEETVLKSTYMDDSVYSVGTGETGMTLYSEFLTPLTKAGMHAQQWLSSYPQVLKRILSQDQKSEVDLDNGQLPSTKTLEGRWLADEDMFTFKENKPNDNMIFSKRRNFLKKITTLFDPINLLSPFTVRAKMLLQNMWIACLDWDEEMPESLASLGWGWFLELLYVILRNYIFPDACKKRKRWLICYPCTPLYILQIVHLVQQCMPDTVMKTVQFQPTSYLPKQKWYLV